MKHAEPARSGKQDFDSLRASGDAHGMSLAIGNGVGSLRDRLARRMVRIGVTPNALTVIGFLFTLIGSGFLLLSAGHALPVDPGAAAGSPRSWYPVIALAWFFLSAACDMLDGAVARAGKLHTEFGAVLDSSVDRFSDVAVYGACALYFAAHANVTYCLLTFAAVSNTFLISYVKARAEDIIPDCTVGYWQRGERFFALLVACLVGHIPVLIWQQAILPFFTVIRRLRYTRAYLRAKAKSLSPPQRGVPTGWLRYVQLWRHPRGSLAFDVLAALNIAVLVFGPLLWEGFYGQADPLGEWLRGMGVWAGAVLQPS